MGIVEIIAEQSGITAIGESARNAKASTKTFNLRRNLTLYHVDQ